jgi:hypothetical protein
MGSLSVLEVKREYKPRTLSSILSAESSHRNLHIEIGAAVVNGVASQLSHELWLRNRLGRCRCYVAHIDDDRRSETHLVEYLEKPVS